MAANREAFLTVTEYRKHIESDTRSFFRNDPELAHARPVPHPTKPNKIIFSAGAMASFFPLHAAGSKVAVKLFFQKIPDLAVRYEEIEATLRRISSPAFIEFDYREGPKEGAMWGSEYTPYLKMECVEGVVLKDAVLDLAGRHDGRSLLGLAEQWQNIALMMEREQIAHGDIQAENLMVERGSGRIRLIDLDTMFVPSLRPRRLRCVAYGIPAWQHPEKETDEAYFDERLDRFSALEMYLCLLALGEDPGIFDPQAVGENEILFTKSDLRDPHSSRVLQRLSGSSNAQVRRITEALVKAALGRYDDVPAFSKVADAEAEAKEALQEVEAAARTGDHRRVCEAWKPVLDTYGPAQAAKAEYSQARKHLEKLERFCEAAQADDDKAAAEIWQAAPDLERCSCAKAEHVDGGMSVADRGAQAVKRMQGVEAVRKAIEGAEQVKRETGLYGGTEEIGVVEAWNNPTYELANSQTARAVCWERVEAAWNRVAAFKDFEVVLATDEDEKIAKAWSGVSAFAPAIAHQKRARDAAERMRVLGEFIARARQEPNDEEGLWRIWQSRADMGQCKSAARSAAQAGGLIPAQRAALAGRRVETLAELNKIFERLERPPLQEEGEKEMVSAWRQREAILGPSPLGAAYRKRADEAQRRLKVWEALLKGVGEDDDEQIAAAWQSGLLGALAAAEKHGARAREAVERMAVVNLLAQRVKADPEDEEGLIKIVTVRTDMGMCKAFVRPQTALEGRSWQERIERAKELLRVRAEVAQVLSAVPLTYDQLAGVWKEELCRKHRLFAGDLARIDEVLELGRHLVQLREGLTKGDVEEISVAWREEFRDLLKSGELDTVRETMRKYFTGPKCVERLEVSLSGEVLTARWDWREGGRFCFLGARDGSFPEAPVGGRPNAFRGESMGGLVTMPFRGNTPHVRLWAMFRFLDQFYVGAQPLERRFATVEYCVSKRLFGRRRLTLISLSGVVKVPALAVVISENPVWPSTEEAQRIPETVISGVYTMELTPPPTLRRGGDLYLSLRPVEKRNEEWLRLIPAGGRAVVIRF